MARIAFPYLAFMSLATLFAAMLNSLSRFAAAAAAPIFLNVCLVIALIAAFLGFSGLAGMAATIAKVLFIVFLILAVVAFLRKKT